MEVIETAPAKINLGLDVLFKRPDGYHELEMIMTSIDLSDRLTFSILKEDAVIIETNNGFLPLKRKNNIYQVIELLKERYEISAGVRVSLSKNIPVSAGLGGGSSDAAATFRGINRLFSLGMSLEDMSRLSIPIGTDIPYCLYGHPAFVKGIGEIVSPLNRSLPSCWLIIVKPKFSVSTPKIFESLSLERLTHPNISDLAQAIKQQDYQSMVSNLGNALETHTSNQYPIVKYVKDKMMAFGADGAVMSGTGPTVIGFCQKRYQANRISNALRGFCSEVYVVRPLP